MIVARCVVLGKAHTWCEGASIWVPPFQTLQITTLDCIVLWLIRPAAHFSRFGRFADCAFKGKFTRLMRRLRKNDAKVVLSRKVCLRRSSMFRQCLGRAPIGLSKVQTTCAWLCNYELRARMSSMHGLPARPHRKRELHL